MSTKSMPEPTPPSLSYASPSSGGQTAAWRLLRLALMLWSSLVLIRHATYWGGVIAERYAERGMFRSGESFPFAEIQAASEIVILFAIVVIALAHRHLTRNALFALRLLSAAFILLALTDLAVNFDAIVEVSRGTGTPGRTVLRVIWQVVSKLQLLVVPAVCALYRPGRD